MFKIEYFFSSNFIDNNKDINEDSLRYKLFLGNIILKDGKSKILLDWDWIPILDFAEGLLYIHTKLFQTSSDFEEFDFTESEEKLFFDKKDKIIKITTSFSEEYLDIDEEDFKSAILKFYKEVIHDILDKNQELINNALFINYLKKAQNIIVR